MGDGKKMRGREGQRKRGHEKRLRRPAMGGSGGGGCRLNGDGHTTAVFLCQSER